MALGVAGRRQDQYSFGPGGVLQNTPTNKTNPIQQAYALKDTAIKQQSEDYDSIMSGYKQAMSQGAAKISMPSSYEPESFSYKPSADFSGAIGNLQNLSQTGGYSQDDINNIRARGISPIRSIYANAQRDMDRQRRLQGGFSPNYNASKVKMARELSSLIGDKVTDVNAGIAERVAQNKMSVAPQLAQFAGADSNLMNQYGAQNVDARNQARMFNIQTPIDIAKFNAGLDGNKLQALQGMTNLYSATPALASTFGQQALQSSQQQNQNKAKSNELSIDFLRSLGM